MVSCSANCEFEVNVLVRTLVRFCAYSFAVQAPFPTPITVITFDPSGNFQTPLLYDWNVAVQQQIMPTLTAQIAYVGSHGTHIFTNLELNPAVQTGPTMR